MASRLGRVARRAREEAGLTMMDIAVSAGVSQSTIGNFELGERWCRETDAIVDAYERELGLEPEELWWRAVGTRE